MAVLLGAAQALEDARESVQLSDAQAGLQLVETRALRDALRALLQWAEAYSRGMAALTERVERLEGYDEVVTRTGERHRVKTAPQIPEKLRHRDPTVCRHLDCDAAASVRVLCAFGVGNFCHSHAAQFAPRSDYDGNIATSHPDWTRECFRHGPPEDRPLS